MKTWVKLVLGEEQNIHPFESCLSLKHSTVGRTVRRLSPTHPLAHKPDPLQRSHQMVLPVLCSMFVIVLSIVNCHLCLLRIKLDN